MIFDFFDGDDSIFSRNAVRFSTFLCPYDAVESNF